MWTCDAAFSGGWPYKRQRYRDPLLIKASDATSITLSLLSPDGDEGYPGNLRARCKHLCSLKHHTAAAHT